MKTSDKDIISAIRSRPDDGFKLLYAKYGEPVYWHIRRLVVSHDDAQDAMQEAFMRIFRSFSQYSDGCSFAAWVYRIATNEALRIIERRKEAKVSLDDAPLNARDLMAESYVDYTDLEAVKLQKAILSLPAKQQLAFNLRYYDELSYDDIAAIVGSSAASAKVNYHIAKEKIVKFMNSND